MATFPSYAPVYSATKSSEPKIRITQLGDGYQQRTTFGLNQNPKGWALTFDVWDREADEIEAFLDARGKDAASFDWVPPDTTQSYKWICRSWKREMYDLERSRISATFEQVFEP
jgi:phage-related protein